MIHHAYSADTFYKFPRSACSLSIASNKLLKFPAPKPSKLFLWMISMKTVGRSISGYFLVSMHNLRNFASQRTNLCEQLQQIPALIKIDKNPQPLNRLIILLQLHPRACQALL